MKRKLAVFTAALMFLNTILVSAASTDITDGKILSDPVQKTYEGRTEATAIIQNVSFSDVPSGHWAKEAITRMGALGLIKGDSSGNRFRPAASVSNEEAIAFVMRMLGNEEAARAEGQRLLDQEEVAQDSPTRSLWSIGYLALAANQGFISQDDLDDAMVEDQSSLVGSPDVFLRSGPAKREDVARWVIMGLNQLNAQQFPLPTTYTRVYNFSDWEQADIENLPYIEAALSNGIMSGVSTARFNPKGNMTRAEMAQVLKNMDNVYYDQMNFEKKTGTVGAIRDEQSVSTGTGQLYRNFYIRSANGQVEVIRYELNENSSPAPRYKNAVVYKNGTVAGLPALAVGDEIEYIVSGDQPVVDLGEGEVAGAMQTDTVYYVQQVSGYTESVVQGRLFNVDIANNEIVLIDDNQKQRAYVLAQGLLDTKQDGVTTLIVDNKEQDVAYLNIGSSFSLTLANNLVKLVSFVGEAVVENEVRGLVIENNHDLGYIVYFDNNGRTLSKGYYESDLLVKKRQYYDVEDEIGYIDQVFPNFKYNPMITNISDIEPGDIVFMRLDPSDNNTIVEISAATNYTMRYGKVRTIDTTSAVNAILVEYENGQTDWIDLVPGIFVSTDGRPGHFTDLMPGDWVKILVNSAIITPGYVIESAKEIAIQGDEQFISSVIRGQIGSVDPVQRRLSLQNYQRLTKEGWSDYQEVMRLDMSHNDMEIYMDGERVAFDYVDRYFKRGGGEAYIAMESFYGDERVKKLTIRTERDQPLNPDTIVTVTGDGSFMLAGGLSTINSDAGTIIVRHGRLVDSAGIMAPDYARVILNGNSRAAVVNIDDAPGNLGDGVTIIRGRIQSVDEGKSFTTRSMALLTGSNWFVTPVERMFAIDYNTKFYNEGGFVDRDTFVDYGANSVYDNTYTIIADGARADWVIDQPYAREAVRGYVYDVSGSTVSINNVTSYNRENGRWNAAANRATAQIATQPNTIIIKNNRVVNASDIVSGDTIRVMTNTVPNQITDGAQITGYIIFVER